MSMKLPAMFDQNPLHTFDKVMKKLNKKRSQSLTLTPNVKVIAEPKANDLGNKKHATQKNFGRGSLSNWCDADADEEADAPPPPTGG